MTQRFRFGLRGRVVRRRYADWNLVPKSVLREEAATAVAAFAGQKALPRRGTAVAMPVIEHAPAREIEASD